jgi:two-component system, LytTR family, sensor kinase
MKIRWREHEMIFVTILAVALIILSLLRLYNPSFEQPATDIEARFDGNGLPFNYRRNVLIPQSASILLMYLGYLSINLLIVPSVKKISFNDIEKLFTVNILKTILVIVSVSYLLAIGVNVISYYARPHLFNYGDYQLLALLGYNDKPLTNIFFGFGRATGLVMLFTAFAGVREFIIWLINRPGATREFRVLIINNVTPLLFIYFLIPFFTNPVHARFMDYLAFATPVPAVYIYLTFWLFPFSEKHTWRQVPVLLRLFISTLSGALFSAIFFSGGQKLFEFSIYWLFLLLIISPLTWLLYQQRRDKILQLKGMETALVKSTADLQFLRSQINPHFLFNALNTLYGTAMKEKSEQTAEGIQMLGDMMRFMLHENNLDFISMNKEIEYLKNYIALQKLRTPPSPDIRIEDNIDDVQCNHRIAPMLLIPFVENAFKHGISLKQKSWIDIKLECTEAFICFEVRNSIHSRFEGDTEKDKSGIGLKNVAERLKLLYPGRHELQVFENGNEFIAKVVIK